MKLAAYESNKEHRAVVQDGRSSASLQGRSGLPMSYEYISMDPEILRSLAACGSDTDAGLRILNGGTYFVWKAA